ncbi:MAG TPA: TetR/AcrR family transcriptional regulator [Solirubrobacterales bacterium]|nr:TetR/AcrR family transcriptional regulator [Solirubrobacterales bacterium]
MNRPTPETKEKDLRQTLLEAVIAETAEFGHAGVTEERILRKAGVSRPWFLSQFADKEAAIEAAFQWRFDHYIGRLRQTCELQPSWPLKVKVGIGVTLDMAAAEPDEARFLLETMAGSWTASGGELDSRDRLARLLVAGRTATARGAELPGLLEPALVGGIASVVAAQLRAGEARRLPALAPELVELTLTPYLGPEEAAEVARRPRPRPADR